MELPPPPCWRMRERTEGFEKGEKAERTWERERIFAEDLIPTKKNKNNKKKQIGSRD